MTEEEQKKHQEKWQARAAMFNNAGDGMSKAGNNMMGIGCLLTLFITIPIIIFMFIL